MRKYLDSNEAYKVIRMKLDEQIWVQPSLDEHINARVAHIMQLDHSDIFSKQPIQMWQSCGKGELDDLLMDYAWLKAIIDAPYDKKGEMMCNVFNVPNKDTECTHIHWFLKPCIMKGVLSGMLWELYLTRREIREKAAQAKQRGDWAMFTTYNAQQIAIKLLMNATYGALGTETNCLALYPGAEVVTFVGRTCIQKCNVEIEKKGYGVIVYNDTDSAMVRQSISKVSSDRDPKKIKEYGKMVADDISKLFPKPMMLECENIFLAFFLKAPKMYAGIKWDEKSLDIKDYTWDYVQPMNLLYIKGMTPVRRDKYSFSKDLFSKILYDILIRVPADNLISQLEKALMIMWNIRKRVLNHDQSPALYRYIQKNFSYNMGITPTALNGGSGIMAQWCNIYHKKYGKKPAPGERFELIVTNVFSGPDIKKHTKSPSKLVTIDWMASEHRELDMEHYISCLSKQGQVIEIMNIAYSSNILRDCLERYYLPKLKRDGHVISCPHCPSDPAIITEIREGVYYFTCTLCRYRFS